MTGAARAFAPSAAGPAVAPPIVHDVLRSSGRPLDSAVRAEMEPRFRHSFADVRVHADGRAAESARAVGAHAYAVGRNVVFGAGRYAPGSGEGRRLIAHELAHVVQQRGASASLQPKLEIGAADDPAEREADAAAERVSRGGAAGALHAGGSALRRRAVFERPFDPFALEADEEEEGAGEETDNDTGAEAGGTPLFDEPQWEPAEENSEDEAAESGEADALGDEAPDVDEMESEGPEMDEGADEVDLGDPFARSLLATPGGARAGRGTKRLGQARPAARRARSGTPAPPVPTKKCTSKVKPGDVVVDHRVTPDRIEKPGDTVTVSATFVCVPFSGGKTLFQTAKGSSLGLDKFFKPSGRFTRVWNGKHQKTSKHRTMMADDGTYTHKIEDLKYAVKGKVDLFATGSKLVSPPITVAVRSHKGTGKTHPHFTKSNADFLGKIIRTEIGTGNAAEQEAVAWAVRNQMLRLNVNSVKKAASEFADHSGKTATAADVALAERILKQPMSGDTTSGAIMWWSPSKFPAPGAPCIVGGVKGDCRGPVTKVTNSSGTKVDTQSPSWMAYMTRVTVSGIAEWNLIMVRP